MSEHDVTITIPEKITINGTHCGRFCKGHWHRDTHCDFFHAHLKKEKQSGEYIRCAACLAAAPVQANKDETSLTN